MVSRQRRTGWLIGLVCGVAIAAEPPRQPGDLLPSFVLRDLAGEQFELAAAARDRAVLLVVWSHLCSPCQDALPLLQDYADSPLARDGRLLVVAINHRGDPMTAREHLAEQGYDFRCLLDPAGEVKAAYGVEQLPALFVADTARRLAWRAERLDDATTEQLAAAVAAVTSRD